MIRIQLTPKTESGGYIVEDRNDDTNTLNGKIEIEANELPILINEAIKDEGMVDMLRNVYQLFEPTSFEIRENE